MSLQGQVALVTGASMGIGEEIARGLAKAGSSLILFSRSEDKLRKLAEDIQSTYTNVKVIFRAVDVGDYDLVDKAVSSALDEVGKIDVLVNNAGLALGAPSPFHKLRLQDIITMNNTNVNGTMFVTYSVLNRAFLPNGGNGAILNISSVTGLEAPPFPGEAVYHANKACLEGFSNSLRNELAGTNIKVLVLRPGCVATNFHSQRVGHDKEMYEEFFKGYQPLIAKDIADSAVYMLSQPANVSIKAMDVVPTAQRSLTVFDREWNERNGL